jgi:hypothetical protein
MEGRLVRPSTTSSYISPPSIPDVVETTPLQEDPVIRNQVIPDPPTHPEDFPTLRYSSTVPPTHPPETEVPGSQPSFTNGIELANWIIPPVEAPGPVSAQKLDHIDLSADEVGGLFQE